MEYSSGWVEDYHYDSIGQLLKVEDTDPTQKDMKQQKHVYEYDACGNMTYEYMRGNGTGEATVENTYTYDALHRVTSVHENYGNDNRSYTYDSLGNLTYETAQGNKSVDYKLNNLNQITSSSDDGWKTSTAYTYDKRGNLIQELYTKNNKQSVTGAYTYDETNKMVLGVNDIGESSEYLYNGLGALVTNTWTIKKNAYGYHDVQLSAVIEGETVVDADSGKKAKKEKKNAEEVTASPELNKTSTVVKEFVVDYTTETHEPLMEHEVNGLDYRYVYGNDRLSVNITGVENGSSKLIENGNQIRLYYHMDYLGTADYLTSPLTGKVESWTHYNEWGEITHNAVLKCGQRELDLVKRYATHDYDSVLGMYYAKARFYDAENRRFIATDRILEPSQYDLREYVTDSMQLVQYLYASNNSLTNIDPLGLCFFDINGNWRHDNWEYSDGYVFKENPRKFTLRQGSTGDAVSELQVLLWRKGYLSNGDCDGNFGPKTLSAVKAFQAVHGLTVDGVVGPKTWAAFFGSNFNKSDVSDIKAIQKKLQRLGYYDGEIDGRFGPKTRQALIDLQRFYTDVPDTGCFDNATQQKLAQLIRTLDSYNNATQSTKYPPEYYEKFQCKESLVDFEETSYEGWSAIAQVFLFAAKAGVGVVAAKSIITAITVSGAATAGVGGVMAGIAFAPPLLKAFADTGVYATLTLASGTLYLTDGGFIIGEASPAKPLGAIVWAFGYPYLKPLNK